MKKIYAIVIVVLLSGCKPLANKGEVEISGSDCPKDGTCSIKIFNNKSITTKSDENNENFHYEMVENTTKNTVVFEYSKDVPKGVMDAGLREEITVEFDNNIKPMKIY
ncbi:hypothetical protein [Flavobacterium sp. 3HN19-14]|uniref:hypothetical protein n=1 Tax=Flavobacterium sp. 3HN19-14 TaxID=3448133 RepID=UPI003EE14F1F